VQCGFFFHPTDEDLSLHPSEQKSLAGDPESAGIPLRKKLLGIQFSEYSNWRIAVAHEAA
jgi:hypothetical protein